MDCSPPGASVHGILILNLPAIIPIRLLHILPEIDHVYASICKIGVPF